jgi:hypothetical protein
VRPQRERQREQQDDDGLCDQPPDRRSVKGQRMRALAAESRRCADDATDEGDECVREAQLDPGERHQNAK